MAASGAIATFASMLRISAASRGPEGDFGALGLVILVALTTLVAIVAGGLAMVPSRTRAVGGYILALGVGGACGLVAFHFFVEELL